MKSKLSILLLDEQMKKIYLLIFGIIFIIGFLGLVSAKSMTGNFITGYNYKSYSPEERKLIIDDGENNLSVVRLISPLENEVPAGEEVMVAEFLFEDFENSRKKLFDRVNFYDLNSGMENIRGKNYWFRYLDNSSGEWIEFKRFRELPYKNISVGLFTNTQYGDYVEWIPEMFNFEIVEWATYNVTSSSPYPFHSLTSVDGMTGVRVDDNHVLIAYTGNSYNSYASLLHIYENGTINKLDNEQVGGIGYYSDRDQPGLVKINSTHYLHHNGAVTAGDDSEYHVLEVDISAGTISVVQTLEDTNTDLIKNSRSTMVLWNSSDDYYILNVYRGEAADGFARVLSLDKNSLEITRLSETEFEDNINYGDTYYYRSDLDYLGEGYFLLSYNNDTNQVSRIVKAYTNGTLIFGEKTIFSDVLSGSRGGYINTNEWRDEIYALTFTESSKLYFRRIVPYISNMTVAIINETQNTGLGSSFDVFSLSSSTFLSSYEDSGGNLEYNFLAISSDGEINFPLSGTDLDAGVSKPILIMVRNSSTAYINNYSFVLAYQEDASNDGYAISLNFIQEVGGEGKSETIDSSLSSGVDSCVQKINNTHYIVFYDDSNGAYARILEYNLLTNELIYDRPRYEFNSGSTDSLTCEKVNDTRYIAVYTRASSEAVASLLEVNSTLGIVNISQDTYYSGSFIAGQEIEEVASNKFLLIGTVGSSGTYYGKIVTAGNYGLTVDTGDSISEPADISPFYNDLAIINDSRALLVYEEDSADDMVSHVLSFNLATNYVSLLNRTTFDPSGYGSQAALFYIESESNISVAYFLTVYPGSSACPICSRILKVDLDTSATTFSDYFPLIDSHLSSYLNDPSLVLMTNNHFLLFTGNSRDANGNPSYAQVLSVNTDEMIINQRTPYAFEGPNTGTGGHSSVKITENYYLDTYIDTTSDELKAMVLGFFSVLSDEGSCECPGDEYSNWILDLRDNCVISTDCNIGIGNLSFAYTGTATFNSTIHAVDLNAPSSGGIVYVGSNGHLCLNNQSCGPVVEPGTLVQIDYEDFSTDFGNWTQATFDDGDWWLRKTAAPSDSASTGPESLYDGPYVMVESSSGSCYTAGQETVIYRSPLIDFSDYSYLNLSFAYNMYGSSMGNLSIRENSTGSWIIHWSEAGNQGTSWFTNNVKMENLGSGVGSVAIWQTCAGSYYGDAAVDSLNLTGTT